MTVHRKSGWLLFVLLGAAALTPPAASQNYPTRPIRWIVPVPAGATTDIVTRMVAQKINESWGQQVIVDNRPGGAFVIGTDIVAKAQPDGHTVGTLLTPHIAGVTHEANARVSTVTAANIRRALEALK